MSSVEQMLTNASACAERVVEQNQELYAKIRAVDALTKQACLLLVEGRLESPERVALAEKITDYQVIRQKLVTDCLSLNMRN